MRELKHSTLPIINLNLAKIFKSITLFGIPSGTLSVNMVKIRSNMVEEHRRQDLSEEVFIRVKLDALNPLYEKGTYSSPRSMIEVQVESYIKTQLVQLNYIIQIQCNIYLCAYLK